MEKVVLRSKSSQAKIWGTVVSISGAFLVTLYKGPPIFLLPKPSLKLHQPLSNTNQSNWVIGGLLLTAEYILVPLWYIVQVNSQPHSNFFQKFEHSKVWFSKLKCFTDTDYERVPEWINRDLLLQFVREHHCWWCSFDHRDKFKCLEIEAGYSISLGCVLGKKLPGYRRTMWFSYSLCIHESVMSNVHASPCLGTLWIILEQYCSRMGLALEGSCVCSNVQASIHCHCCCHGGRVPRRYSLSWKVRRHNN